LRIGQIPIKVGIGKKSKTGEISHPERQIMSWAKDSQYPLKYSRTEPVNDKRKAKSREAENAQSIIAGQLAELKALKAGKSVVVEKPTEPVVEEKPKKTIEQFKADKAAKKAEEKAKKKAAEKKAAEEAAAKKKAEEEAAAAEEEEEEEEDENTRDVEEVSIDGEDYYWDESTNEIFDMDTTNKLGYYSTDKTKITEENEIE